MVVFKFGIILTTRSKMAAISILQTEKKNTFGTMFLDLTLFTCYRLPEAFK